MNETDLLAARFEEHRVHLRSVAYRILGSLAEAEDAVQETWFRLARVDPAGIDNLGGWLTTTVGRICLDQLRSRKARREEFGDGHVPDPVVRDDTGANPEHEIMMADSVGIALMVVLETLAPAERLAFVLHDMFAVPFEAIAPIVERTPAATRQLASRARRRVQDHAPVPDPDLDRQHAVVQAFLTAARDGDFDALLEVLDPDVVFRMDGGAGLPAATALIRGAQAALRQAKVFARAGLPTRSRPVVVNGGAGLLAGDPGFLFSVMAFTIVNDRIVELNLLADPDRLKSLDLSF